MVKVPSSPNSGHCYIRVLLLTQQQLKSCKACVGSRIVAHKPHIFGKLGTLHLTVNEAGAGHRWHWGEC